jgi:nitrate reductase gamma subunit
MGVRVIGWLLLFAGAWNILLGFLFLIHSDFTGPFPQDETAPFIAAAPAWGLICVIAFTGLVLRRDWGRKLAMLSAYVLMVIFLAAAIGATVMILGRVIGKTSLIYLVFWLLLLYVWCGAGCLVPYLVIRYLRSEKVRATFANQAPPGPDS